VVGHPKNNVYIPIIGHQGVDEKRDQDFAELCPNAEPYAAPKWHEISQQSALIVLHFLRVHGPFLDE